MDTVIIVEFIAAHGIIITDAVLHADRYLDGIVSICPRVVIPFSTTRIEFATIEW